jgi:hypothetical protein
LNLLLLSNGRRACGEMLSKRNGDEVLSGKGARERESASSEWKERAEGEVAIERKD